MTAPYEFRKQLAAGQVGEAFLDHFFASGFEITPTTTAEQRQEIDRWYVHRVSHKRFAVEYKTDVAAGLTGNAFVEIGHSDGRPGWAQMSQADTLIYYIPDTEAIYVIKLKTLRQFLPGWMRRCTRMSVPNIGYSTIGLLVPLEEFEKCAIQIF